MHTSVGDFPGARCNFGVRRPRAPALRRRYGAGVSDDAIQQLQGIDAELAARLDEAVDPEKLYALQVEFLGKKGKLTAKRALMGSLEPAGKKAFGQAFNAIKAAMEGRVAGRKETLEAQARLAELSRIQDLTMLPQRGHVGSVHPITSTRRALETVFRSMGFDVLDGPHVEAEQYNFDDLNIASDHPARDMQDTFFVAPLSGGQAAADLVLRTHTSPVQVRAMLTRKPPIRIIAPGTVFRRDDDATHSPTFHQIEGLCIDEGVSMADLKATMERFVRAFFGADLAIRLRPSYFPFVEPGAEFDVVCPFCERTPGETCSVCRGSHWIELGGSGMVHPNVLRAGGIDPERYTGWAFGFGIDRMAMLLHGVSHLRLMFEGDVRFLEQFPC
ncbi:MAG: phenylalanine--tRNA ligase subunit alpha [Nannocystaceae bacterium]|nr:phenylalanine--tRNA ligase subunit alpha [Nannocystaceae bacterium]